MRTFCRHCFSLALPFGIAAFVLMASGCSRNTAAGTAEKFHSDAQIALREYRYNDAEHLLDASLVLFLQAENTEKYNEVTVELAGLERFRGKLSESFEHYNAALAYYQQSQNTHKMVPVLNALADLYAVTGKPDSALHCSSLALSSSVLSGNDILKAASEYERGRVALMADDPATAAAHFAAATNAPAGLTDPLFVLNLALYHGSALTKLGRKNEAIQKLLEAEHFAAVSSDVLASVHLKTALGASYFRFGMYEDAKNAFTDGLTLDSAAGTATTSGMTTQLLCGIGEVFLANYAHGSARTYFARALERAQAESDIDVMGYCLVRLGDCASQASMPSPTGPAILQAVTFYDRAFGLFENDATPHRKAIVLLKEAVLRAALHENADAERLFKNTFDLMKTASVTSDAFTEPFRITTMSRLLPGGIDRDAWWYRPYASFLIHTRRIGDGLAVAADGLTSTGRSALFAYPLTFQDTTRNLKIRTYGANRRLTMLAEYELLLQQTLGRRIVDEQEIVAMQERYAFMRASLLNEGGEIASRYPSLLPLVGARTISFETIQKRTENDASIVSYLSFDGRLYGIVITQKNAPVAVDLGPAGAITERIGQYAALLRLHMARAAESRMDNPALRSASLRLASDLVQPLERYMTKHVIVHATKEIDGLPVHALLLSNGRPVSDAYAVSYAPYLSGANGQSDMRPLTGVVVFGSPAARPIENEYALRAIKNFYPDPALYVTQAASERNFLNASGSVLHLATDFGRDDVTARGTFALSGGSITMPDTYYPISYFLMTRPFRVWLLAVQRRDTCDLGMQHATFALMSGATQVILQRYPSPATYTKDFNEHFYMSLTAGSDAKKAYGDALLLMQRNVERNKAYSSAVFFFVEW